MSHSTTVHICHNTIFDIILNGCKLIGVGGTTFAHRYLQVANKRFKLTTYFKRKEVKTMIIGYLTVISVFLTLIFWLLHKYAVRRAKYLVNLESSSPTGNLDQNETLIEVTPILKPTKPFGVNINGRLVTSNVLYHH